MLKHLKAGEMRYHEGRMDDVVFNAYLNHADAETRGVDAETMARLRQVDTDADGYELMTFSVSSDTPASFYSPFFGEFREVLGHDDGEIDLTRVNDGLVPFLYQHDHNQFLGQFVRAWVDTADRFNRLRGVVRISKNLPEELRRALADIREGLRPGISVGYIPQGFTDLPGEPMGIRVAPWVFVEGSSVTTPMDANVGFNRQIESPPTEAVSEVKKMTTPNTLTDAERVEEFRREIAEIRSQLTDLGKSDEARGEELNQRLTQVNDNLREQITGLSRMDYRIGMTEKEVSNFSLARVVASLLQVGGLSGDLERDFPAEHEAIKAANEKSRAGGVMVRSGGATIPMDALVHHASGRPSTRTVAASDLAGMTVAQPMEGSYIDRLIENSELVSYVTIQGGLQGKYTISRNTGAAFGGWTDGTADYPEADPANEPVALNPAYVGGYVKVGLDAQAQSYEVVESDVRRQLVEGMSYLLDKAIIAGNGTNHEPLGAYNLGGDINTVTGTLAQREDADFYGLLYEGITKIVEDKARFPDMSLWVSGRNQQDARTHSRFENGNGGPCFDLNGGQMSFEGIPVHLTTHLTAPQAVLGSFSQMILGMWGAGLQLVPQPVTRSGALQLLAIHVANLVPRHTQAFCKYTIATA